MAWTDVLLAAPWALPFLTVPRLARTEPDLATAPVAEGRPLSVIIPARNEAENIEGVVRSVLASTYGPLEVIVVDDRSTDDTSAIVARLAAEDPRLRLVHGEELPPGWFGKPWACWQGARAATGEVLAFTDADTRHAPALLGHAVGLLETSGAGLLTLVTHQVCASFWERLVMPQIFYLLGLRFAPATVNAARHARDVIANGQFIMLTRETYEAIGTHAAVRGDIAEDLGLAQASHRHGRRVLLAHARSLISTRMYQNLPQLVEGWSKNIYLGGRATFPDEPLRRALVPLTLAASQLFWLAPVAALLLGAPAGWTAAAILFSLAFWTLISFGMQIPLRYAFGYPLGALATLAIVLRSTLRGGRRVEWRGRVYREVGA